MFDDAVAVRCIRKLETQNLRVFLGLLQTVTCGPISCLRLNDGDGEIAAIAKQIIGTLLRAADRSIADEHNPAIGEALLFTDLRVFPARTVELGNHVRPAGVRFIYGHWFFFLTLRHL